MSFVISPKPLALDCSIRLTNLPFCTSRASFMIVFNSLSYCDFLVYHTFSRCRHLFLRREASVLDPQISVSGHLAFKLVSVQMVHQGRIAVTYIDFGPNAGQFCNLIGPQSHRMITCIDRLILLVSKLNRFYGRAFL